MRRYELVSGAFFTLLALAQLTRLVLRWPVQVAGVPVPLWVSGVAFLIVGAFALWALRSARREHQPA
jgi:putative Ca2+/H+ antiporter (TMEM165/GDT1 family)